MTVICPNCKTIYNLPDDKARPGAKLRCTVCRQIFILPSPETPPDEPPSAAPPTSPPTTEAVGGGDFTINIGGTRPERKKHKGCLWLLILLLLLASGGGAWTLTPWLDPVKAWLGLTTTAPSDQETADAQRLAMVADLQLQGVRQYVVNNEKTGLPISVIEGRVANGSTEPRDLIRVEALMYDDLGNMVFSKSQLAGSMVSLFQLQVLSEQELENALNNQLDIVTNNTNVPPGGSVPFMVLIYNPPAEATNFSVKIIDAQPSGGKSQAES